MVVIIIYNYIVFSKINVYIIILILFQEQKAWRKRQLCYKLIRKSQATYAITDIILLSRSKRAPDGFNLVGYDLCNLDLLILSRY